MPTLAPVDSCEAAGVSFPFGGRSGTRPPGVPAERWPRAVRIRPSPNHIDRRSSGSPPPTADMHPRRRAQGRTIRKSCDQQDRGCLSGWGGLPAPACYNIYVCW